MHHSDFALASEKNHLASSVEGVLETIHPNLLALHGILKQHRFSMISLDLWLVAIAKENYNWKITLSDLMRLAMLIFSGYAVDTDNRPLLAINITSWMAHTVSNRVLSTFQLEGGFQGLWNIDG